MEYYEERLDEEKHFLLVDGFCCGGENNLGLFLTDQSFAYDKDRLGHTYIIREKETGEVLAFYTIKTNGIQAILTEDREQETMPMIEVARIAVQYQYQGNGFGKMVFRKLIYPKIKEVEKLVAVKAIMAFVEKEDEKAVGFYKSLGFTEADEKVQQVIADAYSTECELYILYIENI